MTIRDAVALARKELVETSLEDAEFEARQLAAFCLGKRRLYTFATDISTRAKMVKDNK